MSTYFRPYGVSAKKTIPGTILHVAHVTTVLHYGAHVQDFVFLRPLIPRLYVPHRQPPQKTTAKIFGRSVNAKTVGDVRSQREKGADDDKVPGSFVPGDEADVRVKWQEKIFGPEDIVTLSSAQRSSGGRPQQHRTVGPPNNPLSRLEVRRRNK